jgi:hypothetical protein
MIYLIVLELSFMSHCKKAAIIKFIYYNETIEDTKVGIYFIYPLHLVNLI